MRSIHNPPKMTTLDQIKTPVAEYVDSFHQQYEQVLLSKSEWLQQAVEHLRSSTGKMVRPIMTTLMAGLVRESLPAKTISAAVLLELIHTATLIHDDVIDEASTRRGRPTLNALFDNRIAVLMGDFVLASALIGAIGIGDLRVVAIVSAIGRELTEGEIRQFETAEHAVLDERIYMEVIRQKTAALFRSCAEIAVVTTDGSDEDLERLGECAELLGLAFQIRDDVFDYYPQDIGKPTGNDLREGKVTLPLLYVLTRETEPSAEVRQCLEWLHSRSYGPREIEQMIALAQERGGIDYAYQRMHELIDRAKELLLHYPDTPYRRALMSLSDYILERKV